MYNMIPKTVILFCITIVANPWNVLNCRDAFEERKILTRSLWEPGGPAVQSLWRFQNLVWNGLSGVNQRMMLGKIGLDHN